MTKQDEATKRYWRDSSEPSVRPSAIQVPHNHDPFRSKDIEEEDNDDSTYALYDSSAEHIASPIPDAYEQERLIASPSSQDHEHDRSGRGAHTLIPSTSPHPHLPDTQRSTTPIPWLSLPQKSQLLILTFARLAEPLAQTSLQAYMFYQLQSFNPSLNNSDIAYQAGILTSAFTFAQALTAVWWGRAADWERCGRKRVILIGLGGTLVSTVGFGFSRSFAVAVIFRFLGGALNGMVGVMRTMISEIIKEKKFQPKAFLILPLTYNVGSLIGPVLGGWLQNPVELYPQVFGPGSTLGGKDGVQWMKTYPYAFPNLLMAVFFVISIVLVVFGLVETHVDRQELQDWGIEIRKWLFRFCSRPFTRGNPSAREYTSLSTSNDDPGLPPAIELTSRSPLDEEAHSPTFKPSSKSQNPSLPHHGAAPGTSTSHKSRPTLPYRRIFTRNVLLTFLTTALMHIHISAFSNLWFIFLSTPRDNPTLTHHTPTTATPKRSIVTFSGGLGLPPQTLGTAISILGFLGLAMQFGIYSTVVGRFGVLHTFRLATLTTFPLVYLFAPFLALAPSLPFSGSTPPPAPASGWLLWTCITLLLFIQVAGRTFALPISQILINNCTPHPSVLGAVHGINVSISSFARTVGPVVWSWLYGVGLERGVAGLSWWVLGAESCVGALVSWGLYEGSGHEVWLEGDEGD